LNIGLDRIILKQRFNRSEAEIAAMASFDLNKLSTLTEPVSRPRLDPEPCRACSVRHLTVCAPLEDDEIHEISAIAQTVELGPGDPLFDEGEAARSVFNVTAGSLRVYKLLPDGRRQVIGFLFPGDFVGLANNDTYAYNADAVTHAALCRFPRSKLENLLGRYPKMQMRLLSVASHELAVAQEQMLVLGRKTAKEKIATFLMSLSRRAEDRGQPGNPVHLPMSRTDIGDYLGLTTETVSRTFTQLRGKDYVTLLNGGKVQINDIAALRAIAEGN
jgi:CRP/FNR family transcriptional regulator